MQAVKQNENQVVLAIQAIKRDPMAVTHEVALLRAPARGLQAAYEMFSKRGRAAHDYERKDHFR